MPRKKKIAETAKETIPVDPVAEAVAPEPTVVVVESDAKKEFRAFMDNYKVQNPTKYAKKEAEFNKKLNTL